MDKKRATRIASSLKAHRESWDDHFHAVERVISPRRGLFSSDPANTERSKRGSRVNQDMIDSTPRQALRILQSGMQAGVSSPSRPWFRLQPSDRGLRGRPAVKEFVARVEQEVRTMLMKSGMYNVLHTGYGDAGAYGTECAIIEDSETKGLRPMQLVPGSYWLGMTDQSRVDTCHREFMMSVNQIVGKFVFRHDRFGKPDWSTVSQVVKRQFDDGDVGTMHKISHLITPRPDSERDPKRLDGAHMPIASNYWMDDTKPDMLMGERGYTRNPISASRWEVQGFEVYGRGPGMDALPDARELMAKRRDYAEMLRRINRPTMNAHTDLRNSAFSMLPGAVNFMSDPSKGLAPAFQVAPQFDALRNDINDTRDRIWSAMYADLFMMISNLDRRMITATEIDERKEEKLIALGPVLERLHFEKLEPLIEHTVTRVLELGLAGPPPQELADQDLEIDFISMLAQAQKAVATGSMERLWAFAGNLAAVKPGIMDKLDEDKAIDEYADMLGTPPSVVKPDEVVAAEREAAAQQQQAAAAAAVAKDAASAANQGAQAAQVLSQADSPRGGAPGDVLRKSGLG